MKIYFSRKLKYLTLRELNCEIREGVSVADKFATLVLHIARNIFLNLAGIAQKEDEAIEISHDLNLNFTKETVIEKLNKKVKRDH
jgi:mannitol/fructose-specific phosphotransferase system IIA component